MNLSPSQNIIFIFLKLTFEIFEDINNFSLRNKNNFLITYNMMLHPTLETLPTSFFTQNFIERGSLHWKSEDQRVRRSKVFWRMITLLKDQNVKNQNVKSLKMTFDVLIFFDAIGIIRTSKVLVHFLAKNTFDILILPMASKKIRMLKV